MKFSGKSGCEMGMEDSGSAQVMTFENMRNVRYCEIILVCGDAGQPLYNTFGLNNEENPLDTCPPSIMASFSTEAVKEQHHVPATLNPPRYFLGDTIALPTGTQIRDFAGLKARWMATLQAGVASGSASYTPTTIKRKSTLIYKKGKPVFILDDPEGTPWIMKSYTNFIDKNLTYNDLSKLGQRLKMPSGWKYRVVILQQDLIENPVGGIQRIAQDELQNTYDACDEGAFNYKP